MFAAAVALCLPGSPAPARAVVDTFNNAKTVDGWSQPSDHVGCKSFQLLYNIRAHCNASSQDPGLSYWSSYSRNAATPIMLERSLCP